MDQNFPSREAVIEFLKQQIIPDLRQRGFKGSFPHYRRPSQDRIDLLTFQFDKWGGGFVVELAVCPPEGATTSWGKFIPPSKVTAYDVNIRLRLGAESEQSDSWFRYDEPQSSLEQIAQRILTLLDTQAEEWWSSRKNMKPI